jgi:hypothetical protein
MEPAPACLAGPVSVEQALCNGVQGVSTVVWRASKFHFLPCAEPAIMYVACNKPTTS